MQQAMHVQAPARREEPFAPLLPAHPSTSLLLVEQWRVTSPQDSTHYKPQGEPLPHWQEVQLSQVEASGYLMAPSRGSSRKCTVGFSWDFTVLQLLSLALCF